MDKVPRELKHDAIALGNNGYTQNQINDILGISVSTIQRTKYKLRDHGDIEGGTQKRGPKPKLSRDLEDVILSKEVTLMPDVDMDGFEGSYRIFGRVLNSI
jgi:transposase